MADQSISKIQYPKFSVKLQISTYFTLKTKFNNIVHKGEQRLYKQQYNQSQPQTNGKLQ